MISLTSIKDSKYYYLVLIFFITVFCLLKIEHITLPHYWDEAWSYATAVHAMYEVGPELLPGNVDPIYTRGHPLLFYFLSSSWMTCFGATLLSKHLFALTISVVMIVSLFIMGSKLLKHHIWGLAWSLLWLMQSMFFVQSSMLLPEILVALLAIWSLYCFAREHWVGLAILLSLLLLTKESGFMFLGGIGLVGLVASIKSKDVQYFRKFALSMLFPIAIIVSFFAYQYSVFGWVFFPEHMGMIKLSVGYVGGNLAKIFMLKDYLALTLFILVVGFYLFKQNKIKSCLIIFSLLALALILSVLVENGAKFLYVVLIVLVVLALFYSLYLLYNLVDRSDSVKLFIGVSAVASILYILFCAANFFTIRYLMPFVALLCFITIYEIYLLNKSDFNKLWLKILAAIPFIISPIVTVTKTGYGDTSLGAFETVKIQQKTIDYLVQHVPSNAQIAWGSYQMTVNIGDPACGFIDNKKDVYLNTAWEIDNNTDFVLFDNIEKDKREDELLSQQKIELLFEAKYKDVYSRVYKYKAN